MNKNHSRNIGMQLAAVFAVTAIVGWMAATGVSGQTANALQVNVGESVTLAVKNLDTVAVADPNIADVVPLVKKETKEAGELSIIGKKVGVTTITILHSGDEPTEVYRIEVGNDLAAATIRQMIGQPSVIVKHIGNTLVLDGQVDDEIQAQRAVQVASAYNDKVVNLLEVKNPRQIKIRTRVAEVNTEAIQGIGFKWFGPSGEVEYAMDYNIPGGSILHGMVQPLSSSGVAPTTPNSVDIGLDVILQMLVTKNYAKLLSEPTLVTSSGKEASFLVGQEVPIVQQLPQSFTVEFKEVGVRMKIKPTADSQNRINTTIHAEVSQIVGTGSQGIPIIGAKTADTTLQVNDGQTVVIGGLLENNLNQDTLRKVPWLADIPIFGALFRQKNKDHGEREVLFFMTPEIVKDVDADTAKAAQTPLMKTFNNQGTKGLLAEPDKKDDWGLHNPGHMGLQEKTTPPPKPVEPAVEPTTNFTPARPAGP